MAGQVAQQAPDMLQQHIDHSNNSFRRTHQQAWNPAGGLLLLLVAILLPNYNVLPAAALKVNLPGAAAGAATSATVENVSSTPDTAERLQHSFAGSNGFPADAANTLPTPATGLHSPGSAPNASQAPATATGTSTELEPVHAQTTSPTAAQPRAGQAANASNMSAAVQPLLAAAPQQAMQGNHNATTAGAPGNTSHFEVVPSPPSPPAAAGLAASADQRVVYAADGAEATAATDGPTEDLALTPSEEPTAVAQPPAANDGNTTDTQASHSAQEESPSTKSAAAASPAEPTEAHAATDAVAANLPAAESAAAPADSTSTANTAAGATLGSSSPADVTNSTAPPAEDSPTEAPAAATSSSISTPAPHPGPATDVEVLNAVAAQRAAAAEAPSSTRVSEQGESPPPDRTDSTSSTDNSSTTGNTGSTGSTGSAGSTGSTDNSSSAGSAEETAPQSAAAAPPTLAAAPGTVAQVVAAGVPDRCIITGSSLFSACALEIATAQRRFNISVDVLAPQNYTAILRAQGVTRDEAVATMRQILARPSPSCCSAHCRFNQQLLCDCEPSVLDVAVRFAGADVKFYGLLVEQLAAGCGLELFFNASCPANRTEALVAGTESSLRLLSDNADPHTAEPHVVSAQAGEVIDGFCVFVNGTAAEDGLMPPQAAVDSTDSASETVQDGT